jgi:hypothetical protein
MGKMKDSAALVAPAPAPMQAPTPAPAPMQAPTPAPAPTQAQVPAHPDFNPWLAIAGESGSQFGQLIFYRQGAWYLGDDEIEIGTKYLVQIPEAKRGWVRFENGSAAEYRLDYCRDYVPVPARDTLGFTDESQWETDDKTGEPVDPWNMRHYLPMEDLDTRDLCTWAFWSDGAVAAFQKLARQYAPYFKTTKVPIVSLQTSSYYNKKWHCQTQIPILKFVRWGDRCGPGYASEESGMSLENTFAPDDDVQAPAKKPRPQPDMDDKIPF